jgi:hypothetical protein
MRHRRSRRHSFKRRSKLSKRSSKRAWIGEKQAMI